MGTGMLLSALICFFIFISATYTAYIVLRNESRQFGDSSYAAFLIFAGITWLIVSIYSLLFNSGYFNYGVYLDQYGVQTFILLQIISLAHFIGYRITRNKKISLAITFVFLSVSLVALYYGYRPGSLVFLESSSFLIKYSIDPIFQTVFQILFSLVMLGFLVDVFNNLCLWKKKSDKYQQKYLIAGMAILIYGTIGYFEQQGYILSLVTVLLRITIILSIFISYLAFSNQEEESA